MKHTEASINMLDRLYDGTVVVVDSQREFATAHALYRAGFAAWPNDGNFSKFRITDMGRDEYARVCTRHLFEERS